MNVNHDSKAGSTLASHEASYGEGLWFVSSSCIRFTTRKDQYSRQSDLKWYSEQVISVAESITARFFRMNEAHVLVNTIWDTLKLDGQIT